MIVVETDENGDVTLPLPAGCYYAVITGAGYELVVEEFCLDPGETEINEVDMGEAPATSPRSSSRRSVTRTLMSGPIDLEDEGDFEDFECEPSVRAGSVLDYTNVSMVVGIAER